MTTQSPLSVPSFFYENDVCPERDSDGLCHCRNVDHARVTQAADPCYPLYRRTGGLTASE